MMIDLKNITVDDKALFDRYFAIKQYGICDLNFTNLFMWRETYSVRYAVVDDFLCIFPQFQKDSPFVLMPVGCGDLGAVVHKLAAHFKAQGNPFVIKGVTEGMKNELMERVPGKFIFEEDRNIFDYVYLSADLIELKGKKFHAKRNHINKFKSMYDYTYEPLTAERVDECAAAALKWCVKRNCEEDQGLGWEKIAILNALHNFDKLKFKGGILRVDGKIAAFTFGERLTDNMAVVHVEKGDPDIRGSYAVINQMFCEREWRHMKYVNREEDMGLPGLRKAKLSYRPVTLVEKYTAKWQE